MSEHIEHSTKVEVRSKIVARQSGSKRAAEGNAGKDHQPFTRAHFRLRVQYFYDVDHNAGKTWGCDVRHLGERSISDVK